MNNYEIMFIVKTVIESDEVSKTAESLKQIFVDFKSEVSSFKELGQKKLAYPINKEINGFYYLINVKATPEAIAEFDRRAAINENIIRHLVINLDKE